MGNIELLNSFINLMNEAKLSKIDISLSAYPGWYHVQLFCSFADFQLIAEELGVPVEVSNFTTAGKYYEQRMFIYNDVTVLTTGADEDKEEYRNGKN